MCQPYKNKQMFAICYFFNRYKLHCAKSIYEQSNESNNRVQQKQIVNKMQTNQRYHKLLHKWLYVNYMYSISDYNL